tara:strand:- start:586 stop:960 length:375 start_codon:yes stop_codon:yes gene_type:complete
MANDEKIMGKFTLSAATTEEEFKVASLTLGVDVEELKSTLVFVEHVAHEAERLELPPNATANAAVSFISGCIHSNTPQELWRELHLLLANALLAQVGCGIDEMGQLQDSPQQAEPLFRTSTRTH